jgi:hypothetical protein
LAKLGGVLEMELKESSEVQDGILERTDRSVSMTKGEATKERVLVRAARLFNEMKIPAVEPF